MKKVLSLILVAIMLVTVMPVAVAEGNTYEVGDIIQFGSYPQSEVKDEALIAELNALAPEWDDWTSYGYYSGNGEIGSMVQGDWMRYTDIMYNGNKYRGVKFTQYRPRCTYSSSSNNAYQYDNGYRTNKVYWFKFEPIDWHVLDPATGLVMCETIIDSQPYSNTIYYNSWASDRRYAYFNDSSYKNYASDYETSSIRKWLNNDFYNTAFTDSEKKEINTTTLNNDGYYTSVGTTGYEKLDSNSTNDKIFLLSYNEVRNSNFGFNSIASANDTARRAQGSDYAQSQGLYVYRSSGNTCNNNSGWLLCSPGSDSRGCCGVNFYEMSVNGYWVYYSDDGIRPALCLESINHKHNYYLGKGFDSTCTEKGEKWYVCDCGDSYKVDIPAKGHKFDCKKLKAPTCTEKGYNYYECAACKEPKTDYIDPLGHNFSTDFTIDLDPTCTSEGQKSRHCLNCTEKTDVTVIGKLVHTYSSVITAPTCTAQGYTTYTCSCGDTYVGDYVDKLEHSYNVTTIAPNCTDKGYNVYTCSCGDNYTETIEATGHSFSGSACVNCGFDKADSCSCNCHKSGISGFIWKILSFFYKLFRTNGTCSCGAAHY